MNHSDQPSTSRECIPDSSVSQPTEIASTKVTISEEELQKDAQQLDNRLEECASRYNLSSLNVKNIIFHIIKDPHTLAALLDGDDKAIESLKLTRSRLRELEQIAQTKLNIELKPVNATSTKPNLLNVEFNDDEDDDPDYQQPADEMQEFDRYEFEDFTEEELAAESSMNNTKNLFGHDLGDAFQVYMDPDYAKFIEGCVDPTGVDENWFEENDEDYNIVQDDEEFLDLDEFRNDRSTKISKRELRHLYSDIVPDELLYDEPAFKKTKAKLRLSFGSRSISPSAHPNSIQFQQPINPNEPSTSQHHQNDSFDDLQFFTDIGQGQPTSYTWDNVNLSRMNKPKGSWSLLRAQNGEKAKFKDEEIQCLQVQFEKHAQLLTQLIVSTTGIAGLVPTRNQALRMVHELDHEMYNNAEHSIFQIKTLPEAVLSCHEIESFKVDAYEEMVGLDVEKKFMESDLQHKSSIVLSKSNALVYPELLPTIQPSVHSTPLPNFITAEQMLLALALFELHHVPHSTGGVGRNTISKYQTISSRFLVNKTPNQIRNHLKNVRSGSMSSPLHQLIMHAEKGKFNATIELDSGLTRRPDPPINWPSSNQLPRWLLTIQNLRLARQTVQLPQIKLETSTMNNYPDNSTMPDVQIPPNYSVIQLYDGQIHMLSPNVLQLNGTHSPMNSPIVLLNTSAQIVYNNSTPALMTNQIPNSPFQTYTLTTTPSQIKASDERKSLNDNDVIVIDDDSIDQQHNEIGQLSQLTPSTNEEIIIDVDSIDEQPNAKQPINEQSNVINHQEDLTQSTAKVENEKKSRRLEQMLRCMRGFDDPEVVETWSSLVLQTVYNLVKQRLFMHDGKFKTFLSVLSNPKKSSANKYDELACLLRDTQPELADCIAALMDDEELRQDQEQNPERCAYKNALEMLMNIHIYFNGQQNSNMKRRLLKMIRDLCFTEQNLREEMQKLLSGRHEPLWVRLRQYFRGECYREKIDMSRGEDVPLSVFNAFARDLQGKHSTAKVDLHSEFVDLTSPTTQKLDTGPKPDLRLQNGYFMYRLPNGQSVPVNLCSPSKVKLDGETTNKKSNPPTMGSIFAPEHDRQLLYGYNDSKANATKAVEKFLRDQRDQFPLNECPFNEDNTQKRLHFLLDLLSCMNTANATLTTNTPSTVK